MTGAILFACAELPGILVDAADFDGANDYMTRGAGLTGAVDSKSGILSAWIRIDGGDGTDMVIAAGNPARVDVTREIGNRIEIQVRNSAGTGILDIRTVGTYTASATWLNVLSSWDLASAGARTLYVNDQADLSQLTFTNDTIDYTGMTDFAIGASASGTVKFNGCFAELFFAPGQYLDFSLVSNRRKFISSTGKPVYLGADGSVPTGAAPLVYLHLDDAETVANFATNAGSGGDFTITGALETGSSAPSD